MPTIVRQISASNQDCLVYKDILGNWQFKLDSNDVAAGYQSVLRWASGSGLYFPNIPIPPGSEIIAAYLIFRSSELRICDAAKSGIWVEENANPSPFSTLADYQARSRWIVIQWWDFMRKDWVKDKLYISPEISKFVQKVIDLPAWAEGNPIVFFWDDHDNRSSDISPCDREAFSYNLKPEEAPRLEITYIPPGPPPPPPPPPLPTPPPPPRKGWAGLDLQYEYLDDGFKLTFHTDVPCHLYARMTTTPPRKHSKPTTRRGLNVAWDIRFCFVVYEDNEQEEPGDTLIHTFTKDAWPICERRWFYFIGSAYGDPSPSESPIFEFHFPAPPPTPPPPLEKIFIAQANNRVIRSNDVAWPPTWAGAMLSIMNVYDINPWVLHSGARQTATFFAYRAFLTFDTSSLPDTAKIVSASLEPYVWLRSCSSSIAYPYWQATRGHQSAPVVTGDWYAQNPETLVLGQVDYRNVLSGQYNSIPFNSHGLSHINLTGLTKFCLRSQLDVENQAPPLGSNWAVFHSLQKGAGFEPLLRVHYYPA